MNYGDLKTAIQDYCQNSETTFVAHINDYIIAAEDKVFAAVELPSFWAEKDANTVYSGGTALIGGGAVDILSIRLGENPDFPIALGGPVRYLLQKDYDFLLEAYPGTSAAVTFGIPKYYGISDATVTSSEPDMRIRFGPVPDDVYAYTVTYYGKTSSDSITSGSVDANTTWLSVTFPDVLLYGALVQAYTFMKGEPDLIQLYEKQFTEGIALLMNLEGARQESDSYRPGAGTTMPPPQQ